MKVRRKIIQINEEKCDGCGLCIPSCPEGALQIVNTFKGPKARVVKENFCDGLGACLGECPQGALMIETKEVEEYDEEGVIAHIRQKSPELVEKHMAHLKEHAEKLSQHHSPPHINSCPSSQMMHWKEGKESPSEGIKLTSQLRQWPIQLHLVPPSAPYFKNANLVIAADCVPFAYADFHRDFLREKTIAIGCPKLDDIGVYRDKIEQIIKTAKPRSIKVVHMEVPCCFGLVQLVRQAMSQAGEDIPFEAVKIGIHGEKLS